MTQEQAEKVMYLAPRNVEVLKKLGWKWKLETGQFVIYKGKVGLIDNFCPDSKNLTRVLPESDEFIPIVDWQEIERFLELKDKYRLHIRYNDEGWICKIAKHIGYSKLVGDVEGAESRQKAVMQAVNQIEL